jgi:hypothetical protein
MYELPFDISTPFGTGVYSLYECWQLQPFTWLQVIQVPVDVQLHITWPRHSLLLLLQLLLLLLLQLLLLLLLQERCLIGSWLQAFGYTCGRRTAAMLRL